MTGAPAYVRNGRLDILGVNPLGRAVFAPVFQDAAGRPNLARFVFLDAASQDFYRDWQQLAEDVVALLRGEAGRHPYDKDLTDLIGELSTRSEPFRTWWAAHNVRLHRSGVKRLHHPLVGDLTLAYESLDLTADQGLRLNAYSAEPGSPDQDALSLIASWAAADQREEHAGLTSVTPGPWLSPPGVAPGQPFRWRRRERLVVRRSSSARMRAIARPTP